MKSGHSLRLAIFVLCLMALAVTSCNQASKDNSEPDKPIILLLLKDSSNDFFKEIEKGFKSGMTPSLNKLYQLDVQYGSSETDFTAQRQELNHYITEYASAKSGPRLKIAVITPAAGDDQIATQLKSLNDNNIPVVTLDFPIDPKALEQAHSHYNVFIGSQNKLGGAMAADEMAKHLPHGGTILVLNGVVGIKTAMERRNGFVDRLNDLAKQRSVNYRIIERTANYTRSEAQNAVGSLLNNNTHLDGVFAVNDQMAMGCLEALKQAHNDQIVVVIGYDAIDEALAAIKDGRLAATIVQDPVGIGQKAADTVDKILQHKLIDKEIYLPPKVVTGD